MNELIFESHLEEFCKIYKVDIVKWKKQRITTTLIIGIFIFIMGLFFFGKFFGLKGLSLIITVIFIALLGSYVVYKIQYNSLMNYDEVIKNKLYVDFPNFVVTFCSLSGYYTNIPNIFAKTAEYVENPFYEELTYQFLQACELHPGDIDANIFEFTQEIKSKNNMFFAKTVIDMNSKGYDHVVISRLVDIVNSESDNYIEQLAAQIPLSFIKFASLPIMISMLYLFMFVFSSMDAIMVLAFS